MNWIKRLLEATAVGNPLTRIVPPPPAVVETPKTPRFDATGRRFPTTTTDEEILCQAEAEGQI